MSQVSVPTTEKKRRGASIGYPRIDGVERITGRAKYTGDWKVPGMLYGRIATSTVPHGIVRSVDTSEALSMKGVKAIVTCLDDRTVWSVGERDHKRRVFTDRVRFVGDCIAAVAAESRTLAREAAESIRAEYEELPSVFTIEDSKREGAPKLWDEGNVIGPLTYGFGDLSAAFGRADFTIEADYTTSRVHNAPLEPATSLAWWEGDHLTVVAGSQAVHGCRENLAKDLGLPLDNVRVICLYKGGGFGNKNNSMNYDLIAALLAKRAVRPVMVEYSRLEDFVGVHGRWSSAQRLRAAVRKSDAKLLAVDVRADCDIGAYTRHIKAGKFVEGPEGYYDCEAWKGEIYGVYTNTPVTAHMRAPTGPHSCFAVESLVDEIAANLGVNPLEFRLRNAITKYQGKEHFTSNGLRDCLLLGSDAIGWKERWHIPPRDGTGRRDGGQKLRGIGVAIASFHARLGRGEAVLRLGNDGKLEVYTGVVDIGTGAKSTMAIMAATTLGVPLDDVRVVWGDTGSCPYSIGESGSRTTSFTGFAVREAARLLRDDVLRLASGRLSCPPRDLRVSSEGRVVSRDGRSLTMAEVAASSPGGGTLEQRAVTEPVVPEHTERACFAAHFAEVEVDVETGQVSVTRYVAAHESGEIINRLTAESQVQGSVVMGLGMAFTERVLLDGSFGSMQNSSFLTYRLPNNTIVPKIDVIFTDTEDPYGPKSLGEIGIVPVQAAVGNAIFNATGVRLRKLPFMPEDVLRAIDPSL